MNVPDVIDQTRTQIEKRLRELAPLIAEFERLQAADAALASLPAARDGRRATTRPRKPGRPRDSRSTTKPVSAKALKATRRPPDRRKGTGSRAAESLKLVEAQPGITIPELAVAMGINQNYLYRVLPGLQKEGRVRKQGRGWHPGGKR
jgi:hypothetical protein